MVIITFGNLTKTKNMKYLPFVLLVISLLFSCNKKVANVQRSNVDWFLDKELKLSFFNDCLKYGNNSSEPIKQVLKYDISLQMDFPLGIEGYELADSLGRMIGGRIKTDSIYQYEHYLTKNPDFKDLYGSRVLLHCLDFYESDELDSIIRKQAWWHQAPK